MRTDYLRSLRPVLVLLIVAQGYAQASNPGEVASTRTSTRSDSAKRQLEFFAAIQRGSENDVRRMIERDPGIVNRSKKSTKLTPLQWTIWHQKDDIALFLIKNDADVNAQNFIGITALDYAITRGNKRIFATLLSKGADPFIPSQSGSTPFHHAVVWPDVFKKLLTDRVDVNLEGEKHRTPLHYAAVVGEAESALSLIRRSAEVKAKDSDGNSALHLASGRSHIKMIEALLKHGGQIDARNKAGQTALWIAVFRGAPSGATCLLKHKANAAIADSFGTTPLHWAAAKGYSATVKLLLQHGANPDCRDWRGQTPLHFAAQRGRSRVVQKLLHAKANPNVKDKAGDTPLHFVCVGCVHELATGKRVVALTKGSADVAQLLLRHKADTDIRNRQGFTASDLAKRYGIDKLAQILGADAAEKEGEE